MTAGAQGSIRLTDHGRTAARLAWLGVLVLWLTLGAQPAWAADPVLVLNPTEGAPSSTFSATYTDTPPPRTDCSPGTVDFWWDAAGPGSGNPAATKLGSAPIETTGCTALAAGLVVPGAPCGRHVVYAFRSRNGDVELGTTTSAAFTVTGCPAPTPTPAPPAPTPAPTPAATPTPASGATAAPSVVPSAPPSGSPVASGSPSPSPSPSASPSTQPRASAAASPPPPPPPPPSGPDLAGILVLILLGLLPLGAWGAANFFKLGLFEQGGGFKWASLALALALGGGLVWLGSLKFGLKQVEKTVEFEYTGGAQWWAVPEGVEEAHFDVAGAHGGGGCPSEPVDYTGSPHNVGGYGHEIETDLQVTAGQVLQVNVGGKGADGHCTGYASPASNAAGGFNGGGAGGAGSESIQTPIPQNGGGGGGASDVRHGPYGLAARDIVAGGGGGGGGGASGYSTMKGGHAGCWYGEPGPDANGQGGGGGILTMGGIGGLNGGNGSLDGESGTFGLGGAGADHGNGLTAGGGGGGGWNGGGGGGSGATAEWGGGGGGGGCHWPGKIYYIQQSKNNYFDSGHWFGANGRVIITYKQWVSIFS